MYYCDVISREGLLKMSLGKDGEHYFIADTAEQVTTQIVALMNDAILSEPVELTAVL